MSGQPTILAVHQGYELYGSDRAFISSVTALREAYRDYRIAILLPKSGPLSAVLEGLGFQVTIAPIWVPRRADGIWLLLLGALLFPLFVWRAWLTMRASALCYINTAVVFDFAVAARFSGRPSIIHVHEIPAGPARGVIRGLLRFSGSALVFNSAATSAALAMPACIEQHILHNGTADPGPGSPTRPDDGRLRTLVIGRISRSKGQDLLISAVRSLPEAIAARLDIGFAGAAYADGPAAHELKALLDRAGLAAQVQMLGFLADPAQLYDWCDLVVVPSRRPESFGLVAIEAMAHSRAVLAARHGGPVEIITGGQTGWFFEPGDVAGLADALEQAAGQRDAVVAMGRRGRIAYLARFTEARYHAGLVAIVDRHLMRRPLVQGLLHAA